MLPTTNRFSNTVAKHISTGVKYLALMVGTAIITLGIAGALGGASRDLAERVDRNAEVSVSGVAAIVCILNIEPEVRTDENINQCLEVNGFVDVVNIVEEDTGR
jgi:hypothetical protein